MRFGIDWVSTAVFLTTYVFSRIPGVPSRIGHFALAAACGFIVWYRFSYHGIKGPNVIFVGIAAALGIYYFVRGLGGSMSKRPAAKQDDDD